VISFIIEFLRIWPSRLKSKYKQIGKEVGIDKFVGGRTPDNHAILQDERPALDAWKQQVLLGPQGKIRSKLTVLKIKE
jgi:hypothetical protein